MNKELDGMSDDNFGGGCWCVMVKQQFFVGLSENTGLSLLQCLAVSEMTDCCLVSLHKIEQES